jgi:hypothetical protein
MEYGAKFVEPTLGTDKRDISYLCEDGAGPLLIRKMEALKD